MEILFVLAFAVVLTSFVSEGQKAIGELAKATPKERSLAIAKVMVIILLTVVSIAIAFKGFERFGDAAETMVRISNR